MIDMIINYMAECAGNKDVKDVEEAKAKAKAKAKAEAKAKAKAEAEAKALTAYFSSRFTLNKDDRFRLHDAVEVTNVYSFDCGFQDGYRAGFLAAFEHLRELAGLIGIIENC